MASELYVETLKGLTSGANANKVIVPAGQTLEVADGLRSADMPTGSILQMVSDKHSTEESTGATSFTATSISATITPSSTSNKIVAICSDSVYCNTNGSVALTLYRGSTNLGHSVNGLAYVKDFTARQHFHASFTYVDSPSTTSAVTYTVRYRAQESGHTVYSSVNNVPATLILMEIAG